MICLIPNVNLGVGEMGFTFCDLHFFKKKIFQKILSGTQSECQTVGCRSGPTFCQA